MNSLMKRFCLDKKVVVITGGAGLLGIQHAEAVAEAGGIPVLWDIDFEKANAQAQRIQKTYDVPAMGMVVDITDPECVKKGTNEILDKFSHINVLVNNAANDPKMKSGQDDSWSRFENYTLESWNNDLSVGLTGAFFCSQVIGSWMAKNGGGVILNIASDLSVISPDQRLYRKEGVADDMQPVKPVTYSVVKHGLVGLTKYLATYWADKNIRVNAISPGGVYTNHSDVFVKRLASLIPMGRMARIDEYKATVLFLISEASSYMTGQNLVVDGGRTCL